MLLSGTGPREVGRAWLALCAALALHVLDEALTGFLLVYNPTVIAIRGRIPWLPLPVFSFELWLTGLIVAIAGLLGMSVFVFRGVRWARWTAYGFAYLMIVNAVAHTAGTIAGRTFGSVPIARPMPGFYSSPLLLLAAVWLLYRLRQQTAAPI